jgi:streptogramin lyase
MEWFSSFVWPKITTRSRTSQRSSLGPDGNVWFLQPPTDGSSSYYVSKITSQGHITRYTVPGGHYPDQLVAGPQNSLWFLDDAPTQGLGSVTTRGSFAFFSVTSKIPLTMFTLGADGGPLMVAGRLTMKIQSRRYFVGTIH